MIYIVIYVYVKEIFIILMDVVEFRMFVIFRFSNEEEVCEYSIYELMSLYIYIFFRIVFII